MKRNRIYLISSAVALLTLAVVLLLQPEKQAVPEDHNSSVSRSLPDVSSPMRERSLRGTPREADLRLKAEGARTDVSLSTFPIGEYQHLPSPSGKPAGAPAGEAYIHVPSAGRRIAIGPNQLGEFPAIETRLNDTIGVRVSLDEVKPGVPVRVVILDGGSFPEMDGVSQVIETADWHGVAFEYTTSGNIGTHRILVQAAGQASRIFDFHAIDSNEP